MRDLGIFLIIFGIAVPVLGGHWITPRYLGKEYWKLGKDFKEGKIRPEDKYYLDANSAYWDAVALKASLIVLLIGILLTLLSFIV
ncbi:hypothetical protein [Neisseria sp.]|uniref:hypothetical protein n=1 Tax=Neisseria sp. TaxID=192066 RepID=UPI0028A25106|nr:hypothetical protein [Neisseria sp.]